MALLIVEDDRVNRDALTRLFRTTGRVVHAVGTLEEALAKLSLSPRAVLLDVQLPDGSGIEILNHIRSQKLETKVAIVTGSVAESELLTASPFAPDAVFMKPFEPSTLIEWVEAAAPIPA